MDSADNSASPATPGTARPLLPPDQPIEFDVACQRCTYNLRGLRPDGRCPECGAPVGPSLAGDALQFADPKWLRGLTRGAEMCQRAVVCGIVGGALSLVVMIVPVSLGEWFSPVGALLALGTVLLTISLLIIAAWQITVPNPTEVQRESWRAPRRMMRFGAGAFPVTLAAAVLLGFRVDTLASVLPLVLGSPFGVCGFIGAWGMARYCESLARRAGEIHFQRRATMYFRILKVGWVCFAAALILVPLLGVFGGCLAVPGIALFGAGGLLLLTLPAALADRFEAQRQIAEAEWARAAAASSPHAGDEADQGGNATREQV